MTKRFFLFLVACGFFPSNLYGQEQFPFLGQITSDRVNLRAGPNVNFERLAQFNQGEEIVVVDKTYRWFKIKLPAKAACFIKADFVRVRAEDIGVVTGNRVRLRAGAGENFSVLGRLDKGTVVRVGQQINGWYRIEPIEGSYGYVSEEFVKFKSEVIAPPHILVEPLRDIYRKKILEQQAKSMVAPAVQQPRLQPKTPPEEFIRARGQLVDLGRLVRTKEFRYKLVVNGKPAYYLMGDSRTFNSIINQNVEIKGRIKQSPAGTYPYPVFVVSEVKVLP